MRKLIFLSFLCTSLFTNAQDLEWNSNDLSISNIGNNSLTLKNNIRNTIKVKFYLNGEEINSYLIQPFLTLPLTYSKINVFSKRFFDDYNIKIFYDEDCYISDINYLKSIKQQRINTAKNQRNIEFVGRTLLSICEGYAKEGSFRQKACLGINKIIEVNDFYNDYKQNGLNIALQNKLEGYIKSNALDRINNKNVKTIISTLESYYSTYSQDISIETKDLDILAINLLNYVSYKSYSSYFIDYEKTIRPIIDNDNDGIANLYDKCPNLYGTSKYNGCTKSYVKNQKRINRQSVRRKEFKHFYIDANYSYSDLGILQDDTAYSKKITNSGIYLNLSLPFLQHNIGKSKGCFMIDLNSRFGNVTIKDSTVNINNMGDKKINIFDDFTNYAGISYAFMFNRNSNTAFIISPKIGKLIYSSIKTKNLELQNGKIERDAFLIDNNKSMYYEMQFRFFKKSSFWNSTYEGLGLNFGLKYLTNPKIISNSKYNYNWTIENRKFYYPENSLMFYAGVSIIF